MPTKQHAGAKRYNFQEQVGFLLRKAYQAHSLVFQRMCPDPQLTTAQFAVLCALRDSGACSLTDIGRAVVMDPATTRGIVGRLKERNLVSLADDPIDRRRMIVDLNDEGRALLARVIPHAKAITEATLEPLDEIERVALLQLLIKLAPNGDFLAPVNSEEPQRFRVHASDSPADLSLRGVFRRPRRQRG